MAAEEEEFRMTPPMPPPEPAAQVLDGDRNGHPAAEEPAGAPATAAEAPADPVAPAPPAEEPLPVEGDGYHIRLDEFDGPLDLLLYLIRKEKVDIYDIPISRITDQFLQSIDELERLDVNLDRAGDYLLMAATLMRIKARMLVPKDEDEEDEEDDVDPREELVRRLLEYREFKRISDELKQREEEWREVFPRPGKLVLPEVESEAFTDLGVSIVDLFKAFEKMLDDLVPDTPFRMNDEEYAVDDRMDHIRSWCEDVGDEGVAFGRLFEGRPSRSILVATFLGLLELIRLREVAVAQIDRFGEIWIRRREEVPAYE